MAITETPGKMYALAAVLSVLAIVAVVLRFYSRRLLKTARIEMDDYMILPALVCQIPCQLLVLKAKYMPIAFHAWYRFMHVHR